MAVMASPTTPAEYEDMVEQLRGREGRRSVECEFRRINGAPSCGLVSKALGWNHAMSIDDCDQCWKVGGVVGGEKVRQAYVERVVGAVAASPARMPVGVVLTVAGKHLEGDKAKELIRGVSLRGGEEVVKAAGVVGAEFEREIRERQAGVSEHKRVDAMDGASRWKSVKGSWEQAESFARSLVSRGLLQDKSCPPEVMGQRTVSCFGLNLEQEKVSDPCPSLVVGEGGHSYCGDCGCGEKKLARLDGAKLSFPYLECPRRRPGFSNALTPIEGPAVPVKLPEGAVVVENVCAGVGDAVVYCWVMHSLRAAGIEAFINVGANEGVFRMFGVPDAWRTDKKRGPHPAKGVVGGKGWLRSWLDGYGGVEGVPFVQPPLPPEEESIGLWGKGQWEGQGAGKRVLVFPETAWGNRAWPAPYYSWLVQMLKDRGYTVIVMTTGWTQDHIYPSWLLGGQSLERVVAMIRRADLVVGNDSGPAHLAGTMGVKMLALCGLSPRREFFEHMSSVRTLAVEKERMPCVGCNFEWSRGYQKRCERGCAALMQLGPIEVMGVVEEMLA